MEFSNEQWRISFKESTKSFDILITEKSEEEYLQNLIDVLHRLESSGLKRRSVSLWFLQLHT